jgi:hypothetical protein
MTTWQEFESEAPRLAEAARSCFTAAESHVLATLRRDGSPRVSGTEVDFRGSELFIGSMLGAVKALDLRRDGRCAIHANPGTELGGGDAKLAGVAVEVTDPAEIEALQGNSEPCHVFRLGLTEAVLTSVRDDTLVIDTWHPGRPAERIERPGNGPAVRVEV